KFGILQKHDCLCVDDFAAADHFESFAESWLKDLDVLAFVAAAASFVCLAARGIFCGKKSNLLGEASRAHIGLEQAARILHRKSGLFLHLLNDPAFGICAFEPPGTNFHQAFMTIPQIGGNAELTDEDDPCAPWIIEQDRCDIPGIIDLARYRLDAAIKP